MLYEAAFRNLTYLQAQAMYRVAMNLEDNEPMYGNEGCTWSGLMPNLRDPSRAERTITIAPMAHESKPTPS